MLKLIYNSLIAIIFTFLVSSHAPAAEQLAGKWLAEDQSTTIEVSKDATGSWLGTLNNEQQDEKVLILYGIEQLSSGYRAKLNGLDKKRFFDADMQLIGNQLNITIKSGFFLRTLTWTKLP
ncbi:hypothetical protein [Paraferrimonas sp. SM1919]|uniref:hypothetical protein n=1 Tax=Paraferrimonas sp. SM1919 TaxID=2662263 RepID=UPI0013D13E72|nr:hypothetical protein [Paraferrimonas sp. SM1919]